METYLRFVNRYAKLIIFILLLLTGYFAWQLSFLTVDSNPYLLPEEHPARKPMLDMQKEFTGTFDAVLVALYNKEGVFNRKTLDAVYELTQQSRRIILASNEDNHFLLSLGTKYSDHPQFTDLLVKIAKDGLVQNDYFLAEKLIAVADTVPLSMAEKSFVSYLPSRLNPIKELASMAATENMFAKDGMLITRRSLTSTSADPRRVREEIMNNEMMINGVVSKDETVALITVELYLKQDDAEGQLRAYDRFQTMVKEYQTAHPDFQDQVFIAGVPIFVAEQKKLIDRDMATLFPVVFALIGLMLIAYFRKPLGFILPMVNVTMCTVWTLGLMSVFRVPLDLITSALPVFLITICGADAIHIMIEYYDQKARGLANAAAVAGTMREMISPVILTTVTTVVAFLVSTATNISSMRSFGWFMSVGLIVAQIISLLLIPAWLNVMGSRRVIVVNTGEHRDIIGNWLVNYFKHFIGKRKVVLPAFAVLLGIAIVLAAHVNVDDAGSEYFPADNQFRIADSFVNQHIAGTSPGWIAFEFEGLKSVLNTDMMLFLEKLDQHLLSQENVTYTYSLAKYVKRMFYVMNDMKTGYNRLPSKMERIHTVDPMTGKSGWETVNGDDIIAQSVLMYENGGGSDLTNVLNSGNNKTVTLFTMNTTRASEFKQLLAEVNRWIAVNKPAGAKVTIGGTPVIWTGVLDEIMRGQMKSFFLAFGAVAVILIVWLRSVRLGILASLPLLPTLIFYYAIMMVWNIDLNIGTALISFLIVGIVDYSVHYLYRIKAQLVSGTPLSESLLYAIRHSGKSILFNVFVFSVGFLALLFSKFTPIIHLGLLVSIALIISGFMSVFLISMLAPAFFQSERMVAKY